MANEYKNWTISELIEKGARLKYLLQQSRKLKLTTHDIRVITKGFETLDELRNEYRRRVEKRN